MLRIQERLEPELSREADLCERDGTLNRSSIGWARKPIVRCNLKGAWPRKKKWNYWCVIGPDCLFSATISDLDYVGMVFVYYLDFRTLAFTEKTVMVPLAKGIRMPMGVEDSVQYHNSDIEVSFVREREGTGIRVKTDDFDGKHLEVNIRVSRPSGHETLNVVIPWNDRQYQFTSKQEALPAKGSLAIGEKMYAFTEDSTYATLDFGRGIWPYRSSWNWAMGAGKVEGHTVGLNLGGTWTDGTGMTENGVVIDGKLHKISDELAFRFDPLDHMLPWTVATKHTDEVGLVFTPFYEREAKSDLLFIHSKVSQMVGRFDGEIRTGEGECIRIREMLGTIEDHHARW
jgi:hypothetical protein